MHDLSLLFVNTPFKIGPSSHTQQVRERDKDTERERETAALVKKKRMNEERQQS